MLQTPTRTATPDPSAKLKEQFEAKYTQESEPWDYDKRAVEILRHLYVIEMAMKLSPKGYSRILDVGCAMGQLTSRLNNVSKEVYAIDVSETAVMRAQARIETMQKEWAKNNPGKEFPTIFKVEVGGADKIPYPDNTFELVLFVDGLEGWFDGNEALKQIALKEAYRVLQPNGYCILTDYRHPRTLPDFVKTVTNGPLKLVQTLYMNDRLCYQFIT